MPQSGETHVTLLSFYLLSTIPLTLHPTQAFLESRGKKRGNLLFIQVVLESKWLSFESFLPSFHCIEFRAHPSLLLSPLVNALPPPRAASIKTPRSCLEFVYTQPQLGI